MPRTVLKLGGEILSRAKEIAPLLTPGEVVLIHGAGQLISEELRRMGIDFCFERGLRRTPEEAMVVIEKVFCDLNAQLVSSLRGQGVSAVSLRGEDVFCAEPMKGLGRVGEVKRVKKERVEELLREGIVPVLTPLAKDRAGKLLNVNADHAAASLALALKAKKLIFVGTVGGVLDTFGKLVEELNVEEARRLVEEGVATMGMVTKLEAAEAAVRRGVDVWITSLEGLAKLFTGVRAGTRLIA